MRASASEAPPGGKGTSTRTGLVGQWDYMGTTTIKGVSYKVYNASNSNARNRGHIGFSHFYPQLFSPFPD